MATTLTAEGTATRGFVKCFWASKNPSAELCQKSDIVKHYMKCKIALGMGRNFRTVQTSS